jgi:hypothetical protein
MAALGWPVKRRRSRLPETFCELFMESSCGWRYANDHAGKFQFRLRQDSSEFCVCVRQSALIKPPHSRARLAAEKKAKDAISKENIEQADVH